jgi:hypothetical protein
MRFVYTSLIFVTSLSSCAVVNETYAPDGRKAYSINCSGMAVGWDKCFQAAGEKCGSKGYDILSRTSENQSSISANGQFGLYGGQSNALTMLVACKN